MTKKKETKTNKFLKVSSIVLMVLYVSFLIIGSIKTCFFNDIDIANDIEGLLILIVIVGAPIFMVFLGMKEKNNKLLLSAIICAVAIAGFFWIMWPSISDRVNNSYCEDYVLDENGRSELVRVPCGSRNE